MREQAGKKNTGRNKSLTFLTKSHSRSVFFLFIIIIIIVLIVVFVVSYILFVALAQIKVLHDVFFGLEFLQFRFGKLLLLQVAFEFLLIKISVFVFFLLFVVVIIIIAFFLAVTSGFDEIFLRQIHHVFVILFLLIFLVIISSLPLLSRLAFLFLALALLGLLSPFLFLLLISGRVR